MSDSQTASAPTPEAKGPPSPEKREQAAHVIGEILRLMGFPATLDLKDAPDGGISVALQFAGEVPGVHAGKRSHLIDSLQFIANKIVNRPTGERRWISIGVDQHPEPRPHPGERIPKKPLAPPPPAPALSLPPVVARAAPAPLPTPGVATPVAPKSGAPSAPRRPAPPPGKPLAPPPAVPKPREPDEYSLDVTEDPALREAVLALAKKSAELGRFYALAPMKLEDRARVVKGLADVPGMKVMLEGEGKNRRVVFIPDKPAPLPKRAPIPDYGEDEDDI